MEKKKVVVEGGIIMNTTNTNQTVNAIELKDLRDRIDFCIMRLHGELDQLTNYLDDDYANWINLHNDIINSLKKHNIVDNNQLLINDFANYRYEFLIKKQSYINDCLQIIKEFDSNIKSIESIDELTAIDAVLTSILMSLGISYPPEIPEDK